MADKNKDKAGTHGSEGPGAKSMTVPEPMMLSRSQCVKEGFGSWPTFMHSYQLKPWEPDDVEEGNQILDGLRQCDHEEKMEKYHEQVKNQRK